MVKKYGEIYADARQKLLKTESPREAGMLVRQVMAHASGKTLTELISDSDLYAQDEVILRTEAMIDRLAKGEPLAYVLGEWEFYGIPLTVGPEVLIPRDDTCAVAELAIHQALFLQDSPRILDLCTGSGCIGLAVANRVKDAKVTLADLSREALAVAKKNVQRNKMSARVSCVQVDATKQLPPFLGKFDLIVSNPPYVTTDEMETLEPSVKDFEPHMALWGGSDGLDFYRAITAHAPACLKPGGYLCFEFGMGQGDAVCELLTRGGFAVLDRVKDFHDRERAVLAQYLKED